MGACSGGLAPRESARVAGAFAPVEMPEDLIQAPLEPAAGPLPQLQRSSADSLDRTAAPKHIPLIPPPARPGSRSFQEDHTPYLVVEPRSTAGSLSQFLTQLP